MKFQEDLVKASAAWRKVMARHGDEWGIVRDFAPAKKLRPEHVAAGARLYSDRYHYISTLPKNLLFAEVGVWKGDFSAFILDKVSPAELHLIDRDLERFQVPARFSDAPSVHCRQGDSVSTLATYADKFFDVIYIDAGHQYSEVRADADAAIPKLKPNGTLIFNDYIFWSHTEALPYGVVQAVNELCVLDGWRMTAFCLQDAMYCDVALTRAS